MRVLVTTPSFGAQSPEPWDVLLQAGVDVCTPQAQHPLAAGDLAAELTRLCDVQALVVGLDEVDATVLAHPTLRVVAKHGVGTDNIDLAAAAAAGVSVVNAPGSNSGAVADLTMALLLASVRRLLPAHTSTLAGGWDRFPGVELAGRTLSLLGFGRIGQGVAHRAQAFGMDVLAYDPYLPAERFTELGVTGVGLAEAVARADVLSLHLPATPGGAPLLDADLLASMPPGSFLVNAARGELLDQDALAGLLRSGHLAGAALDALAVEPLPADSSLHGAPNLIITPHIGAQSDRANAIMGTTVAQDVLRVLRGDEPHHRVS